MKIFILIIFITLSIGFTQQTEKFNLAIKLLKIQNLDVISEAFWNKQVADSKHYDHKDVSDSIWTEVQKNAEGKGAFLNKMAEIYANEFSKDELSELIQIMDSKVMIKMKQFDQNSNDKFGLAAMKLGKELGDKISELLKSKNLN